MSDAKNLREKIYMVIKDDIKNSRLAELIEKKPLNRNNARELNSPKPCICSAEGIRLQRRIRRFRKCHEVYQFTNANR